MKKAYLSLIVAFAMVALVPALKADTISPSTTITPTPTSGGGAVGTGTIVDGTGWVSWSYNTTDNSGNTHTTSGYYDQWVIQGDSANPYGPNAMTFVMAVQNDSGSYDSLSRITESAFGGYLTNVGYNVNAGYCSFTCSNPDIAYVVPDNVSRSFNGDVIGWNWSASSPLDPNTWTNILVIFTNASDYTTGQVALIDGATTNLAGFAPTGAMVPEPATAGLLGLGLLVLGAGITFKRRAASLV